jgi:hypothetical protein
MTNKTELMKDFEDAYTSIFQFPTNEKDFAFSNNNYHSPFVNYSWLSYQSAIEERSKKLTQSKATIEKLREILKGIDAEESEGGWWETSEGAEFGARKLSEIFGVLASQADKQQVLVDAITEVLRVLESSNEAIVDVVWTTRGDNETLWEHCSHVLEQVTGIEYKPAEQLALDLQSQAPEEGDK